MEAFQLRLWDGRLGRWLSVDPYGQYHSPYLGMGNNPVNRIDPDGGWSSDCPDCVKGWDLNEVVVVGGKSRLWTTELFDTFAFAGTPQQYFDIYGVMSMSEWEQKYSKQYNAWRHEQIRLAHNREMLDKLKFFTGYFFAGGDVLGGPGASVLRASSRTFLGGLKNFTSGQKLTNVSNTLSTIDQGYHIEVINPIQINQADALKEWDNFLGNGTRTDIHPRTGAIEMHRIVVKQTDGTWRSIRFGNHEMKSVGTNKMHYHEEIWTIDSNFKMNVDNTIRRVK